jgi:uncharacterized membrane protein
VQWSLILYPFLVHAAVVLDSPWLEWAAIMLLGWNLLAPWLVRRTPWAYPAAALMIAGGTGFVVLGDGQLFLYAAPVLIFVALFWLFGQTLLPGRRPLITVIADAIRGPLPASVVRYTRRLTLFWVSLFALMALANLLLALLAPAMVWSLFTNFISYLLIGLVFLVEWLFRQWYLGDDEPLTWRQYLRGMLRLDYRRLFS